MMATIEADLDAFAKQRQEEKEAEDKEEEGKRELALLEAKA